MQNLLPVIAISLVALIIILALVWRRKKYNSVAYRINRILQQYMEDELKYFIIPDGIGGLLEVEHLILLKQGLLLIETYPMQGDLFGAEKIDQWTQIVKGRSYKFNNPLHHIWNSRQALKVLTPHIPVYCRLVFTSDAQFPKGKPAEVSTLETLEADLQFLNSERIVTEQAKQAWNRVLRIARKDGKAVIKKG